MWFTGFLSRKQGTIASEFGARLLLSGAPRGVSLRLQKRDAFALGVAVAVNPLLFRKEKDEAKPKK